MRIDSVLLASVIAVTGVHAQPLTLQQAVDIALRNNLNIQIARNTLQASQIGNHISMAGGLPDVTASLSDNQSVTNLNQNLSSGNTIKRSGNANNSANAGVTGSFLVFNGFRVYATKSRLAAIERQSDQQLLLQILNITADVMTRYYDIIRQQSYMQTMQQAIDVTLQRKQIAEARQSVGLANNADTYQAQLDLNAAQQEYETQQLVLLQAKAGLMNVLMQRPDSLFQISDTIIVDSTLSMDSVVSNINRNPEFLAATEQVRINEMLVRETAAQRYPAVSVSGGYNFSRSQSGAGNVLLNQNYGPFIGATVAVPIFNGGIYRRQQRIAEINVRSANASQQMLENNLQTSAVQSWQAYQNILQRLKTERENNRIAYDLLQLTLKRYELANVTIIELREAQRSFVEEGYRLVNLAYSAKIAEIELKRLMGRL